MLLCLKKISAITDIMTKMAKMQFASHLHFRSQKQKSIFVDIRDSYCSQFFVNCRWCVQTGAQHLL